MAKDQYEVLEALGLTEFKEFLHLSNIKMMVTIKGYLFQTPPSDKHSDGFVAECLRVVPSKYIINGTANDSQKLAQVQEFTKAMESLKGYYANTLNYTIGKGTLWPVDPAKEGEDGTVNVTVESVTSKASTKFAYGGQIHPKKETPKTTPGGHGLYYKASTVVGAEGTPVTLDADKIMEQEPVALADAKMLYAPVTSTSPGSKYFVVAIGEDFNVAARVKNDNGVSIRVEGNISKYKDMLEELGIQVKGVKYASLHIGVSSKSEAAKVIGSVIMGMQMNFNQVAVNLKSIMGKGV